MPDAESLDPIEALRHIKVLARAGQDAPDEATSQKHFEMIVAVVEKALQKKAQK